MPSWETKYLFSELLQNPVVVKSVAHLLLAAAQPRRRRGRLEDNAWLLGEHVDQIPLVP